MKHSALFVFKQWILVYDEANPSDANSSATGFCTLPISLTSYSCQVYVNYFNHNWYKNIFSSAVSRKRHANFIVDTQPSYIDELNGFNYGLDFSPTVSTIGIGFYAFLVCIKRK